MVARHPHMHVYVARQGENFESYHTKGNCSQLNDCFHFAHTYLLTELSSS
jgi:hypothetical protein